MKSQVIRTLTIGIALVAVAAMEAQTRTVTADVPFAFYMGNSAMPQGAYNVKEVSYGAAVCIQSATATKVVTIHKFEGSKPIEPARLVFHRYGDSYFLAEIWNGSGNMGQQVAKSTREKELAQAGAARTLAVIQLVLHR